MLVVWFFGIVVVVGMTRSGPDVDTSRASVQPKIEMSCSQRMFNIGDTVQNLQKIGFEYDSAMGMLRRTYGPAVDQLRDFVMVVYSKPSSYWSENEIGNRLRQEAINQGCV